MSIQELTINIYEVVDGNAAVSSDDGDSLYKRINKAIENNISVILDFNNIKLLTSTFLNAAIGQLYSKYNSTEIKERLTIKNTNSEDLVLFKKVVERAKEYFENKKSMDDTIQNTLGDE